MPQQQSGSYHGLVGFGLLGFNVSATVRVISRLGLIYWGLMPQQQSGSYHGLVWFIGT